MTERYEEILSYWFSDVSEHPKKLEERIGLWFGGALETDAEIRKRFEKDLLRAAQREYQDWTKTLNGTLALVILFDQFPRNIYRDQPRGIQFDPSALSLAQGAVARGEDRRLEPIERVFMYLPFEHSEDLALQDRGVDLFTRLANEVPEEWKGAFDTFRHYAVLHRDMIARFGRFPDRNEMLGRKSTPEEIEILKNYPF
jgi:uncharacterized protein (DUF924 family)